MDVEDIAKAAFALLHTSGHQGKRYEMTGPEALSMTEIAEQLSLALGKTVRYVNIPPAERTRALLAAGVPSYIADALDVQASERRKEPLVKRWCIPRRILRWPFVPPPSRSLRAAMPLSCVARWWHRNRA